MKTEALLSLIAHYELACGAEKAVPAMSGFSKDWTNSQRAEGRKLLTRYAAIKKKASADLADMLEGKAK